MRARLRRADDPRGQATRRLTVPALVAVFLAIGGTVGAASFASWPSAFGERSRGEHHVEATGSPAGLDNRTPGARASRGDGRLRIPPVPKTVAGLRRAAEAARDELTAATARWKRAKHDLVVEQARLHAQQRELAEARRLANEGRERIGALAATQYKSPDRNVAVLLDSETRDRFLRSAAVFDQVTRIQDREVSTLVHRQRRARVLARDTATRARQLTLDEQRLGKRREALAEYAALVERRLTAALAELEAKRLAAQGGGCSPSAGYRDYPNGLIPADALCPLPQDGEQLRADAALAFTRLNTHYRQVFGEDICVTDSYRSLSEQQSLYAQKPGLAAVPGTSNHGWGVAVDLCGGAETYGDTVHEWLDVNGDQYGWDLPGWAREGGSRPEPWHWEYNG